MLLFLQTAHGFLGAAVAHDKSSSTSQLTMAWTLPNQPTFQPSWYQDCGNPTARRVVYDDLEMEDEEEFYISHFSDLYHYEVDSSSSTEQEVLPRGARLGRAARRAFQGLRNTLKP